MSIQKEYEFMLESGMSEEEILAEVMESSMRTSMVDFEQASTRDEIERRENEEERQQKIATARVLKMMQDEEYQKSLEADMAKFAIVNEDKDEYDYEDDVIPEVIPIPKEEPIPKEIIKEILKEILKDDIKSLREARLKFFAKK